MKNKIKRKFTLRTALMTTVTLALVASAAVFIGANAAENVTPSDVSPTRPPSSHHAGSKSVTVTRTDVSYSDVSAKLTYNAPEDLGDPVITMTTSKGTGNAFDLEITGNNVYVDYGDGIPVAYPGDQKVKGNGGIKIYGDNITKLICSEIELTALNVSGGTNLSYLDCSWNSDLSNLDVTSNTALVSLKCNNANLNKLDLSKNTALEYLDCNSMELGTLELTANTALTYLDCCADGLYSLDISKNTALTFVECTANNMTEFDVSSNTQLETLRCGGNNLSSIDVSKNKLLKVFHCDDNYISSIDVSSNTLLQSFQCSYNNISSLDVSKNTALQVLWCYDNSISSLDLSNNGAITELICNNNAIAFSGFTGVNVDNYTKYQLAPQAKLQIPSALAAGKNLDLSSEYSVNGATTKFTWYDSDGNVVTPASANGGIFTFGDDAVGKTLICKMANAKLPDFNDEAYEEVLNEETGYLENQKADHRLTTTEVKIEAGSTSSNPGDDTPSNPGDDTPSNPNDNTSSDPNDNNSSNKANNNVPYYDLTIDENNIINDVVEVKYPEGTNYEVDGKWTSPKNVRLTVGNIEENKKKSVLDAIKKYNETFDTDTSNIALYDISLTDTNKAHVTLRNGHVLICLKYPDNLGRQSEDYIFHLYHQKKDGNVEEIPVICRSNGIWFYATDFSPYVLYWHPASVGSAGTGESFTLILVMTALCALSLVGVGYVLYRRKKTTAE